VIWEAKAAVKPDPYLALSPLGARWIDDEASVA
jgi:branched-chain amino acid transport system substrate-binding protein